MLSCPCLVLLDCWYCRGCLNPCLIPSFPSSSLPRQVDVRSLKELMWRGLHSTAPPDAPPSPDTVLHFQARVPGR